MPLVAYGAGVSRFAAGLPPPMCTGYARFPFELGAHDTVRIGPWPSPRR